MSNSTTIFPAPSDSKHEHEHGSTLSPAFNADGLITAVATEKESGDVVMLAHMNADALSKTIETSQGWFWSRSRKKLWLKGETSGNILHVHEMRMDCDQDAVWMIVSIAGDGAACHTGEKSCFFREITKTDDGVELKKVLGKDR